jgi:hypothetical protein
MAEEKADQNLCDACDDRVLCVETGIVYDSCTDAGNAVGVSPSTIKKAAGGYVHSSANFHWDFVDLERKAKADLLRAELGKKEDSVRTRVICLESGVIYRSVTDAARDHHVSPTSIMNAAKGRTRSSAGMHWEYVDQEQRERAAKERTRNAGPLIGMPVCCLESGVLYPTAGAACWSLGISAGEMKNCLKGDQETAGGLHWKRVEDKDYEEYLSQLDENDRILPENR